LIRDYGSSGSIRADVDSVAIAESPPPANPFPIQATLGANIYLQTSAEYRACCLQIYKTAELRLASILEHAKPKLEAPAVVMDLDETVFDNSAFETWLLRNGLEYSDERWAIYERGYPQDVTLIPGAKAFIDKATSLGVAVVFISNRMETYRTSTEAALANLGIAGVGISDRLYLKPQGGSGDKASRRELADSRYNVVLYFGDNLRDFSEAFTARSLPKDAPTSAFLDAIKDRQQRVDAAAMHWGIDWFVIPNPVYGEWEKLISLHPLDILHPTSMAPPAR
jgi:acid phosphatase